MSESIISGENIFSAGRYWWVLILFPLVLIEMGLRNWVDPNWRHELTNSLIVWGVIAILGVIGTAIYSHMTRATPAPLYLFVGGGALIGALIGFVLYLIVNRGSAPKEGAPPPIAVTDIRVLGNYEVGKILPVELVLKNSVSGLKVRSCHAVLVGLKEGKNDYLPGNRRQFEADHIWPQYEESVRHLSPETQTIGEGSTTVPIEAVTLSEEDVAALKNPNGIVYVLGQFDYGTGTLEYCVHIQPAKRMAAVLCVEHNGPVPRPAFK